MLLRIVAASLIRQGRRRLATFAAVALGTSVAAALLDVYVDIGDRMAEPLSAYGANIRLRPAESGLPARLGSVDVGGSREGAFLREADLPRLKSRTFWRHNILAFAPLLPVRVRARGRDFLLVGTRFRHPQGDLRSVMPYWGVRGAWVDGREPRAAMVGAGLAAALGVREGDAVSVARGGRRETLRVRAVFESGGDEDFQLFASLAVAQALAGLEGRVKTVLVRALIEPPNALYEKQRRDPGSLSPEERERYECVAFAENVARDLGESLPGSVAEPILPVAAGEGRLLKKATLLAAAAALAALIGGAATAAAGALAAVLARRGEIALLRSLGATGPSLAALLLGEALAVGLAAGAAGWGLGGALSAVIGEAAFSRPIGAKPASLPWAAALGGAVSVAGGAAGLKRALAIEPADGLKGTPC